MPRYCLTVAYDGTAFHGWQRQVDPGGVALRTVQEELERAVQAVVREPVSVTGASRTDAGVHARGQIAAFTSAAAASIPLRRLPLAINARLPADVQVRRAAIVDDAFDPIADCIAKGYRYRLAHDLALSPRRPLFDRHVVAWTPYRLDIHCMDTAAQHLVGTHDFASFTRLHHGRQSTVRTVIECRVEATGRRRCAIHVAGNGFLYNMVRIIAGTLLEAGRGRIRPDDIPRILEARDRRAAGATMPPEGLCLMWVKVETSKRRNVEM